MNHYRPQSPDKQAIFETKTMALPLAIPILMSLAGSGFGMFQQAKENRKNQDILNSMMAENQMWFNKDYYGDFAQTPAAQTALTQMYELLNKQSSKIENAGVVTGATPEAMVAQKAGLQDSLSQFLLNLYSNANAYKENAKNRYLANKGTLQQSQMAINQQKAESWGNFMDNAVNAGMGLAMFGNMGGNPSNARKSLMANQDKWIGGALSKLGLNTNFKTPLLAMPGMSQ